MEDAVRAAKLISFFVILSCTVFFGIAPYFLLETSCGKKIWKTQDSKNGKQSFQEKVISLINCFAAGVFIAVSLMDLLPDVVSDFQAMKNFTDPNEFHIKNEFPLGEFVIALGFLLILVVEQVAYVMQINDNENSSEDHDVKVNSSRKDEDTKSDYESFNDLVERQKRPRTSTSNSLEIDTKLAILQKKVRAIFLVIALSVHSVFAGFPLGMMSVPDSIYNLLLALSIHKSIMALSLGINIVQSELNIWRYLISIVIFSAATPIGILFGMIIYAQGDSPGINLVKSVGMALATGSFFFVTFFEILPFEFQNSERRLLKTLFVLIGFVFMTFFIYALPA